MENAIQTLVIVYVIQSTAVPSQASIALRECVRALAVFLDAQAILSAVVVDHA